MSYDKQKLLRFQEAILEDADEKIANMNKNISKYEQRELNIAKQDELEKIYIYMQNRVRHLKSKFTHELTKRNLKFKKEILSFRNELVEKVMQKSKKEILKFTNSNKYRNYLLRKVKQVFDEFDFNSVQIKIRSEDLKFKEDLLKINNVANIIVDDHNKLGGFIMIDTVSNVMIDKTIVTLLNNQRQSFFKTSGLILKSD